MTTLAAVIMVKNEQDKLLNTLQSVKDVADCYVVLDTGSTDKTIDQIQEFCKTHNKKVYIEKQDFHQPFHFSNARNHLLKFADDKADYLLLLDASDELRHPELLRTFIDTYSGKACGFLLIQEWESGSGTIDKYFNNRLIKSKHGWYYKGAIHEYITRDNGIPSDTIRISNEVCLYQNRNKYGAASQTRFIKDEEILEEEYKKNISLYEKGEEKCKYNGRNLFYYAQTCLCLGKLERAYHLYKLRSNVDEFLEEKYLSYYNCGNISVSLKHDWEESINWYLKAYEFSSTHFKTPRSEPLYKIAEHYKDISKEMSYLYLRRCCELEYPTDSILFVGKHIYDYERWHLLGIIGYYVNDMVLGRKGCIQSILSENKKIDRDNLRFYLKEGENADDIIRSDDGKKKS